MTESDTDTGAGPRIRRVPSGDDRERLLCPDCGFIAYENPKVIVGSVVTYGEAILLCKRAIPPRKGYWTLPAGFLELNESTDVGAKREAWEEATAEIEIDALLAIYEITRISQIQFMYRAQLLNPDIAAGPESAEVGLFAWADIPWREIAFPSAVWALNEYYDRRGQSGFAPATEPKGRTDFLRNWPAPGGAGGGL